MRLPVVSSAGAAGAFVRVAMFCLLQSPAGSAVGDDAIHLGVATCAGSNCHGSSAPKHDTTVLQTEFMTWHRKDRHSQAFQSLTSEAGQRIARNLGIEDAGKSETCLVCHADHVPPHLRGRRFQVSDGVGCEACHGAAENWLGLHVTGHASHADNVAAGMYPTDSPEARARLCLGCHMGDAEHPIDHRIMGAGHPRLSFELDTFTEIAPAHFRRDADYRERKGAYNAAMTWAIGQLAAAHIYLQAYRAHRGGHATGFPEFSLFSCHSCHRPLDEPQWQPRGTSSAAPGTVRIADAHLLMVLAIARGLDPNEAALYERALSDLHAHSQGSTAAPVESAGRMLESVDRLRGLLAGVRNVETVEKIALGVIELGKAGEFADYAAAEQAVMAIDALGIRLRKAKGAETAVGAKLSSMSTRLHALLKTERAFRAREFQGEMDGSASEPIVNGAAVEAE